MIRYLLFLPLSCACLVGCSDRAGTEFNTGSAATSNIRTVTLRSHLVADATVDPVLRLDEILRVQPDEREPLTRHEVVEVRLPHETPYSGNDAQQYLRGYAVGQVSRTNDQFL